MATIRSPPVRPAVDLQTRSVIRFCHPGYPSEYNVLIQLPRVDEVPGRSGTFGVHHKTALLACQIIANNAFEGLLSIERGGQAITTSIDGILTEAKYFFLIPV